MRDPRWLGLALLLSMVLGCSLARPLGATPVRFSRQQTTSYGDNVYVSGNTTELGNGDITRALKLSPTNYPDWFVQVDLPPGQSVNYRYVLRSGTPAQLGNASNGSYLTTTQTLLTSGTVTALRTGALDYLSGANAPVLEIRNGDGSLRVVPFQAAGAGRTADETHWRARLTGLSAEWQFRINLGQGNYDVPAYGPWYVTTLNRAWLQDGQLFDYQPAPTMSASRVVKLAQFSGRLSTRPLYIYLPRGYDQHTARRYPVLYMHDGQNCFNATPDGLYGQWGADAVADQLIAQGRMRECIIAGVSHGGTQRIMEYLPPDSSFSGSYGRANTTADYYQLDVKPYLDTHYRTLTGRDDTAVCGSSMGGLFSLYLGYDYAGFARNVAAVSTAFGVSPETLTRISTRPNPTFRLWLDSGTQNAPGTGDDNLWETYAARDALLARGLTLGNDFQHYLALGATHSETSWNARLDKIFLFLFPIAQEANQLPVPGAAWPGWLGLR